MREVSETLEAAQSSNSRTPYIHLVFTSYDELTTYDLSSDGTYGDRILLIDHSEEPYGGKSYIVLNNYDGVLPSNLTGFWTEIGYGDATIGGNEYSATSILWVKSQQEVVGGGKHLLVLMLEGVWSKMAETIVMLGSPPYYNPSYTSTTVLDILDLILAELDPPFSLQTLTEDDGIIDTYEPNFSINDNQQFENAASIAYSLLKMTFCYLLPQPGKTMKIKFLQESDSVDVSFYLSSSHQYIGYRDTKKLRVPNHIFVVANSGEDGLWTDIIVKEATDTDSIGRYGDVPAVALAPEITNQDDAQDRADVILARILEEAEGSMLTVHHDCRIEQFDKIRFEVI